jgi:transcriptional regulator with XRE-family HTH domain
MLNTEKLRNLRGVKKQKDIAARLGISQNHYSQIEGGTRSPSMEVATRLAQFFGVGIEQIVTVNPPPPLPAWPRRARGKRHLKTKLGLVVEFR